MTIEVLLLINIAGLTLLGYMIAINAHGPTRLGLSYLVATLMLAGTVWVVVQHVNADVGIQHRQEMQLAEQKLQAQEAQLREQAQGSQEQKAQAALAEKLRGVLTKGTSISSRLVSLDLHDRSVDYDILVARASAVVKEADELKAEFEAIPPSSQFFTDAFGTLKEAVQLIKEAAYYYRSFYSSEDSDQEDLRSRIMRQKAKSASELFQKAGNQITT